MRTSPLAILALALTAASAVAQAPAGPEFRVNTYVGGFQFNAWVAANPNGGFVVVWIKPDGSNLGVGAQVFDSRGLPLGPELLVNSYTTGGVGFPKVSTDASGGFTVVWGGFSQYPVSYDVFGRRFDASGAPLTGELRLNSYTTGNQLVPSVASRADRGFVVVWHAEGQDGSGFGVMGQRFDAAGARLGIEFLVNSYTTGSQTEPEVATDAAGNFAVVWTSHVQEAGGPGIFGQRFTAAGARSGSEFRVGAQPTGGQDHPQVAMAPAGSFVVAWNDCAPMPCRLLARRFAASGAPQGTDLLVYSSPYALSPGSLAMDATGRFVAAWTDRDGDGSGFGVQARRFDATGAPRGRVFRVNTTTTLNQSGVAVASDPNGNVLATWASDQGGIPGASDIYAQRYGRMGTSALAVDTVGGNSNGNRVLEPGETVDVRPSWQNNTGDAQPLSGTLGALSGPAGATYSTVDGAADYGTVPDGAIRACGDCYGIAVSAPPNRPALHWDTTAREVLLTSDDDARANWSFHVGDSFADVPQASPFYRFVETLLHRAVTGGCGPTMFCPSGATTREQMAVFVLRAKEDSWFAPLACTTPMFGDVPASSPFCPWVEELARRGVTTGCGGGNYCPSAAVSREQMAVFVLRTLDPNLDPPACATPVFNDVPASSPFCRWIEELARRGIVTGCGGGNYCPGQPVTREQMAVFLTGTFGLTLYGP